MSESNYDVVFQGEVISGFELESVKQSFAALFKISEGKVEQIFSGARVTLKGGLPLDAAEKYQRRLQGVGANIELVENAPAVELTSAQPPEVAEQAQDTAVVENTTDAETVADDNVAVDELAMGAEQVEPAIDEPMPSEANAPVEPTQAVELDEPRELKFTFNGSGTEYFRIWIVNLILSILTLGIYSAWAKVRNKQYFYGNTELEGSTFSYLASPITILKGRLIAVGIVIAYSVATSTPIWWVSAIAVLGMLLVSPFFVQRSLMFNARNSAYRNIRFNFSGSFKEAAIVFALLPILMLVVFGGAGYMAESYDMWWLLSVAFLLALAVIAPYFVYRQKHYFVDNSEYGTSDFTFSAGKGDFLGVWIKLMLWTIVAFVGAAIVAGLVGALLGISVAGLGGDMESDAAAAAMIPMIISIYVIMAIAYLFPFIYYSVHINNLVFNSTSIKGFQLSSDYQILSFGKLVLVNTLLTIVTLGLFRPWAMVRTAQYKADHISVVATEDLDGFVAGEEEHISALGEEVGDFYDLDFGF